MRQRVKPDKPARRNRGRSGHDHRSTWAGPTTVPNSARRARRMADGIATDPPPPLVQVSVPVLPPRDLTSSLYGPIGRLIKRMVSFFLAYHTYHQDQVNQSFVACFEELARNQAALSHARDAAASAEERLVVVERQLDLARDRFRRISASLQEHDERIDDLGQLLDRSVGGEVLQSKSKPTSIPRPAAGARRRSKIDNAADSVRPQATTPEHHLVRLPGRRGRR